MISVLAVQHKLQRTLSRCAIAVRQRARKVQASRELECQPSHGLRAARVALSTQLSCVIYDPTQLRRTWREQERERGRNVHHGCCRARYAGVKGRWRRAGVRAQCADVSTTGHLRAQASVRARKLEPPSCDACVGCVRTPRQRSKLASCLARPWAPGTCSVAVLSLRAQSSNTHRHCAGAHVRCLHACMVRHTSVDEWTSRACL